jgi:hypothetical protein
MSDRLALANARREGGEATRDIARSHDVYNSTNSRRLAA